MVSPARRRGRPGVTWAGAHPRHLGRREGEAWQPLGLWAGPVGEVRRGWRLRARRDPGGIPALGSFDLGRWQRAAGALEDPG